MTEPDADRPEASLPDHMRTAIRDPRALLALTLGAVALVFGVSGAATGTAWLAGAAGVAGAGAAVLGYLAVLHLVRKEAALRTQAAQLDALEVAVADQVHARITAEHAATSLGAQLSKAERSGREDTSAASDRHVSPSDPDAALTDATTGLYGEAYFRVTVDGRLAAARRHLRPVGVVLLEFVENVSTDPQPANPMAVCEAITTTLREADTACRMNDGHFALVLEDTPETGAIWTIERIRRRLADTYPGVTMWAGVACYPAHAFDRDALLSQAGRALTAAKDWRQDRIEVAATE